MGNLYRILKGKMEGSGLEGKSSGRKGGKVSAPAGGKQGMADALAEMTKRQFSVLSFHNLCSYDVSD